MAVREWSGRRLAAVWFIGIVSEAALVIVPGVLAQRYIERKLPRLQREYAQIRAEQAAAESAWTLTEQADSISVANQRRSAIDAGSYSVSAQGDTNVAVVRTPSGRPDSVAVAKSIARTNWIAAAIVFVLWGSIPVALSCLTIIWLLGRRRVSSAAA
jgi:hypothetical protein